MNLSYHQKIWLGAARGLPVNEWPKFLLEVYRKKIFRPSRKTNKHLYFHPKKLKGAKIAIREGSSDLGVLTDLLAFERYLPEKSCSRIRTILDLGANIGCSTSHFAALFSESRIVGVELEINNYELALQNTASFRKQIELIHGGVWSSCGRFPFAGKSNDAFSICENFCDGQEVNTYTIEKLIDRFGISCLDFVKMDIEGAEEEVLLKCQPEWLKKTLQISIEVHKEYLKPMIYQRLVDFGFQVNNSSHHWCGLTATRANHSLSAGRP